MKDYMLSQQYALIGLDGLDSHYSSNAKKAALRAIFAAKFLETLLEQFEQMNADVFHQKLNDQIRHIRRLSKKEFSFLEKDTTDFLLADGAFEIIPDLLGCDINYYTSSVDLNVYRCAPDAYRSVTESVRAEILEDGPVTTETFFLLWLFRESGCFHDIFSRAEQEILEQRVLTFTTADDRLRILWEAEFRNPLEACVTTFLQKKHALFKDPFWQGVNLNFPFLERRQAVFVDFVVLGTSVADRRAAMICFLREKGHYVEELKNGSETLLKVDNNCYRIFPATITAYHVPIQGARLVPAYR